MSERRYRVPDLLYMLQMCYCYLFRQSKIVLLTLALSGSPLNAARSFVFSTVFTIAEVIATPRPHRDSG